MNRDLEQLAVIEAYVPLVARRVAEGLTQDEAMEEIRRSFETSAGSAASLLEGSEEIWRDPIALGDELLPVDAFHYEMLPDVLRPWVRDVAERMQCPPDYPAVSAMVALATVVGRRMAIRPKRADDWTVVPNLWGAIIGRPGLLKTPALQETLRPLRRLEMQAKERFEKETEDFKAAEIVHKELAKAIAKDIQIAAKEDGPGALAMARELTKKEQEQPQRVRFITNDSTVEKLGEILVPSRFGLLVFRDELTALFRSLDKEGQECARGFFLEAWNGDGRYVFDRIGRGTIDIEAAVLSLLGGIQPGPLSSYMKAAVSGGVGDDGLVQRLQMLVWPDPPGAFVNIDRAPDRDARDLAYATFETLSKLGDGVEAGELQYQRFEHAAQDAFDAWREGWEVRLRRGEDHVAIEAHLAKYRSLVPSLALLIHLADGQRGSVSLRALERALRWIEYLESHARRVYGLALSTEMAGAKALGKKLKNRDVVDGFSLKNVYDKGWTGLSKRGDVQAAVDVLEDHNWIRVRKEKTPGRDRTRCWINPRIWNTPRGRTSKASESPSKTPSAGSASTDLGGSAEIPVDPEVGPDTSLIDLGDGFYRTDEGRIVRFSSLVIEGNDRYVTPKGQRVRVDV